MLLMKVILFKLQHCEQARIFSFGIFLPSETKSVKKKKKKKRQWGGGDDVPGLFLSDLFAISESFDLWQLIAS